MGRAKYSEGERARMITNFLQATRDIINREGVDGVSIRKVAGLAGFNSATIYLYFKDADELITMASMGYLEEYCRVVAELPEDTSSPMDIYVHTWQTFCRYAFRQPQVYYRLFYHPHSHPLDETVEQYYQLFPELLKNTSGTIRQMLHAGSLSRRNMQVLNPLAQSGLIPENKVDLVNDLTLCYFRKLLEEQMENNTPEMAARHTKALTDCLYYLAQ